MEPVPPDDRPISTLNPQILLFYNNKVLTSMTLVHRNSSLQSSLRLLSTSALCHHPTKLFSLSSRHYYCKVAQNSISNGILSHRTASSMRNGMTSSCRDDEDKDNQKAGEYLLFHAIEIIMLIMILMIL